MSVVPTPLFMPYEFPIFAATFVVVPGDSMKLFSVVLFILVGYTGWPTRVNAGVKAATGDIKGWGGAVGIFDATLFVVPSDPMKLFSAVLFILGV